MAVRTDVPTPAEPGGTAQWVGLEELAEDPAFQEMLHREFPEDATAWSDPVTRRQFLTLAGASVALAGIGCSPRMASPEKIYPYVRQPEQVTLGVPLFFATGSTVGGVCTGVLAKSREGRPIKLEGNPTHPTSTGAIDAITQASLLNLYDPDRSRLVLKNGIPTGWDAAVTELRTELNRLRGEGKAIRLLSDTIGSPALGGLILEEFLKFFSTAKSPAKWIQFEPANRDNAREGSRLAYGEYVNTTYDFTKAYRVLSLDADFLTCMPGSLRYSRDFNRLRNTHLREGDRVPTANELNRLYVVESMLTPTGGVADHRLPMRSADVEAFARAVARELGVASAGDAQPPAAGRDWVGPIAKDLQAFRGKSLVIAGDHQPPTVHALAHAMNGVLGNIGTTVLNFSPAEVRPDNQAAEFKNLVDEMNAGSVAALIMIGVNPVFTSPADVDFATALDRVPLKVHMGSHADETAGLCTYHFNEAHFLETWGDGRGHDGTASICQPLIAPLFNGHSPLELIASIIPERPPEAPTSPREIVKAFWRKNWPANGGSTTNFDAAWQRALQDGVIPNSARPAVDKQPNPGAIPPYTPTAAGLEVNFRPDPAVWDGRFANNGWLQELPKPITKLTWDNAIIVSPTTAASKGLNVGIQSTGGGEHGRQLADIAELTVGGRKVRAAVWIQPGHADDSITFHFGYGRQNGGRVLKNAGFNAYTVRTSNSPWNAVGAEIAGTGETYLLASTQAHFRMEGRRPVRRGTRDEYDKNLAEWKASPPDKKVALFAKTPAVAAPEWQSLDENVPGSPHEWKGERPREHKHEHGKSGDEKAEEAHHDERLIPLSIVPATNKENRRWAMAIDLTACHGCNACVTACMAENNIPVVGKKEVTRGREMHWIRVDRYYEGRDPSDAANLVTHFQPVPCQQCEKAPCEVVCPVAATVHSFDGLNDMVYNRCVGTRYCSNNCPYKVRRFNFLTFADFKTDTYKLMRNPEVTVRERGVMEKCTYCVQRIRAAEIEAERQGRPVRDGEVVTSCQAACPAGAIVFGDLSDPKSRVNVWKQQPTNYGLLAELNTMPRTSYLAAVRNPNPDMPKPKGA
ncbi:MAG TPA: TAT-variant-translocated molybdopterin oxidoreductase [Gemmataceae bacterium]|nr:TAT-variant-translocated molybdopterin oxidoreductase [Gemmataceae bacterium]